MEIIILLAKHFMDTSEKYVHTSLQNTVCLLCAFSKN